MNRGDRGIDVSHWQGDIDWAAVAKSGIKFAILKCGGSDKGFYKDSYFDRNYDGATTAGLLVGAYYYVGADFKGSESGHMDAVRALNIIDGRHLALPLYCDVEATRPEDKVAVTEAALTFCNYVNGSHYAAGIYASEISGFRERLVEGYHIDGLNVTMDNVNRWVARYGHHPAGDMQIWQCSSKTTIPGISGYVDLDIWTLEDTLDYYRKAAQVLMGLYGNDDERKNTLKNEGYDPDQVQSLVNMYCKINKYMGQ